MEKERYEQLSPEEIKQFEDEHMTENQKTRSNEREETIEAAGGKLEDAALKTKIKQLDRIIDDQNRELYGKESYEIMVESEDGVRVGISIRINEKNCLRLENPRTHEIYSIPIKSIKRIEKAGWNHEEDTDKVLYKDK